MNEGSKIVRQINKSKGNDAKNEKRKKDRQEKKKDKTRK